VLVERKGERLEVEDISDTEEAIDPDTDTERMRGELGVVGAWRTRRDGSRCSRVPYSEYTLRSLICSSMPVQ
jgi:hypothetical protein